MQLGVPFNLIWGTHTAAEKVAFERRLAEAGYPALQTALGSLGDVCLVLEGGGEQVDVAEAVVFGIHGVHAVDECLHLTAHLVVVDGRRPANDVDIQHALHDGGHVVLEDAGTRLLARQAAYAEPDVLATQRDEFHLMPGGFCAFGKLLRHSVAVRALTETG